MQIAPAAFVISAELLFLIILFRRFIFVFGLKLSVVILLVHAVFSNYQIQLEAECNDKN